MDKWLWAARFFKTRRLATESIKAGHVTRNGVRLKPAKEVSIGDVLRIQKGLEVFEVSVLNLAEKRGSSTQAKTLYEESDASLQARAQMHEQQKRLAASTPAPNKRPDKKSRRQIIRFQRKSG